MNDGLAVEMRGICKSFGPLKAVDGVDFLLSRGSVHGLLGENGAGKTTLMNILYGFSSPDSGTIKVNGTALSLRSPQDAVEAGIAMVHQHFMLARNLTVTENVMLPHKGFLIDERKVSRQLRQLSDRYGMKINPDARVSNLSVGEQQKAEILSAIHSGASILLLDEPTAVLTPQESDALMEMLRRMREDGKSIVLITHKLDEILSVVDEVTVLRRGRNAGSLKVYTDTSSQELIHMMIGRDVSFDFPPPGIPSGNVCLSVQSLSVRGDKGESAVKDVSFDIREGEILGLAGVDGNGQRELAETLAGMRKAESGHVLLRGEDVTGLAPSSLLERRVSYIPEDRQRTGLALKWSVEMNLALRGFYREPFSKHGLVRRKAIARAWAEAEKEYSIKCSSPSEPAGGLSGGNQQKIIIARELGRSPGLLIASHPTRGLDIGATEYVRSRLIKARDAGTAVLLVSADLDEIMQLSDRIAVIYGGRIAGILSRGASSYEIGDLMMGKEGL